MQQVKKEAAYGWQKYWMHCDYIYNASQFFDHKEETHVFSLIFFFASGSRYCPMKTFIKYKTVSEKWQELKPHILSTKEETAYTI